jgi:hypothetical protein
VIARAALEAAIGGVDDINDLLRANDEPLVPDLPPRVRKITNP